MSNTDAAYTQYNTIVRSANSDARALGDFGLLDARGFDWHNENNTILVIRVL